MEGIRGEGKERERNHKPKGHFKVSGAVRAAPFLFIPLALSNRALRDDISDNNIEIRESNIFAAGSVKNGRTANTRGISVPHIHNDSKALC